MFLEPKAYDFAQRILKIYYEKDISKESKTEEIPNIKKISEDPKRTIGNTNYQKFEQIAKMIEEKEKKEEEKKKKELEESEHKKELLKMGCNNDLRKERQLMDKPVKDKIEASKIFKNEGDDYLKQKNFDEAINSYEKGLLQLFYCFSDDPKEEEEADKIKQSLNLNASFCFINLKKYDEALGYLNEALRIDKNNLKTLYRLAFCYFNLERFDDSKNTIKKAFDVCEKLNNDKDLVLFQNLNKDIEDKLSFYQQNEDNLYKKMSKV
jgi:tetratricopeptide (TPR) repeat protein